MVEKKRVNVQEELANKTDNRTVSDKHRKGRILAQNKWWWLYIIRNLRVIVKRNWQVYVTSELKIKLLCFLTLRSIVWVFISVEKRYLSFSCTKIRNNLKRTKTSRNEVMQSTTSN